MKIEMPRIELSEKHKIQLSKEHEVTLQTVRNALRYFSNSDKAIAIRKGAIELLESEAKSARKLIK
jgi:DeoR/GlpR family transcriptional regulator of sugar metabolism